MAVTPPAPGTQIKVVLLSILDKNARTNANVPRHDRTIVAGAIFLSIQLPSFAMLL